MLLEMFIKKYSWRNMFIKSSIVCIPVKKRMGDAMDVVNGSNKSISYIEENGITVVITAFNRREFINQAIDSVLKQRCLPERFEIIIITNFDLTLPKTEVQIRTLNIQGTMGEYLAKGLILSKYDIVAFLEDDDVWEEDKICGVLKTFKNDKISYYHNSVEYIDTEGNRINYRRPVEKNRRDELKSRLIDEKDKVSFIKKILNAGADFNMSSIVINKKYYLPYTEKLREINAGPDAFFFWISIMGRGHIFIEPLVRTGYRVHEASTSGGTDIEKKILDKAGQKNTYSILVSICNSLEMNVEKSNRIKEWLNLLSDEMDFLYYFFKKVNRRTVLSSLLKILRYPWSYKNTLRTRIIMIGFVYLISPKIAFLAYVVLSHGRD
ncbi:MAG: glycosyltransferase [Thermoplasmata archaeon]